MFYHWNQGLFTGLGQCKIYNPWHIKRTWVGSKRQIQPNIAGLGLECIKLCDTWWLAMEGKLLRNLGQSSRTGYSRQYNTGLYLIENFRIFWVEKNAPGQNSGTTDKHNFKCLNSRLDHSRSLNNFWIPKKTLHITILNNYTVPTRLPPLSPWSPPLSLTSPPKDVTDILFVLWKKIIFSSM